MSKEGLSHLTALELGKAIREGQVKAKEAVASAEKATQYWKEKNNAYITFCADRAEEEAASFDREEKNKAEGKPLAGVPAGMKDNICTRGIKTSCASKILGEFRPPYSATVMERFQKAGGILMGKLNMDEFAMGSTSETSYYGPVLNPWNKEHVPGGSSGGAAAAVCSGECWYALGSDTGGSIRQPASYCGITGMKPTYGTVSRYGLIAYASSLDQIGPLARSARDCAAVLDMLQGPDEHDSTTLPGTFGHLLENLDDSLDGYTIGIPDECFDEGLDEEVAAAVLSAADVLKARGAKVERFSLTMMKYAVPAYYILACAEASSNLSRFDGVKYGFRAEDYKDLTDMYVKTRTEGFGLEVKRRILLGTFVLSAGFYEAYYRKALEVRTLMKKAFDEAFEKYDLLLTPVSPVSAPRVGESLKDPLSMYLSDIYTVPVNLCGLPAISVPCGFNRQHLPIGAQLIGQALCDQKVLNGAAAFQEETDYHLRHPAGFGGEA